MIRKAWYAAVLSEELGAVPRKVTVLDQDMVLFRDADGVPRAFAAYCPHRGCDWSRAAFSGGELVCPFHGWRFSVTGRCTHVPANRKGASIPASARARVYPACDRAGLTWVYGYPLQDEGDGAAVELPLFPECDLENWRKVPFQMIWSANFGRAVESVLDVSHLPFVHPETTGEVEPAVDGPEYEATDKGILIRPAQFAPSHPMEVVSAASGAGERTEIELLFPNQWMIRTPMGGGDRMCTFLTFTPVDRRTTRIFGMVMRNFDLDSWVLDELHLEHTRFVMEQDREIVECLRPVEPPNLRREAHVSSDAPAIRFRAALFAALAAQERDA